MIDNINKDNNILGFGMCKCLTQLEKYHLERSLYNELKKTEKEIIKEKKEYKNLTRKGKSLQKTKKELETIKSRIEITPDCTERYGE